MTKKEVSLELKKQCDNITDVKQYRAPLRTKSEPPEREKIRAPVNGLDPQRARSVIHALSRMSSDGTRPTPNEQCVPAYSGAQSCCYPPTDRSQPHYHTTYNEPPGKSVMYSIMTKIVSSM